MRTRIWAAACLAAAAFASGTAGCGGGSTSRHETTPNPAPVPTPTPTPTGFQFGTQGPWPVENRTYDSSSGIRETPVVGMTTDEDQNRWVATQDALYLLRPGDTTFRRYDGSDGLHTQSNPAHYCNDRQFPKGQACPAGMTESWGAATSPGITTIAGGGKGEVFVGYHGDITAGITCTPKDPTVNPASYEGDYCDPLHNSGKIDRVRLQPDGSIAVDRMDLEANAHGMEYWHDRWIQRLLFDHFAHPHTLYSGSNHGVTILFPDLFRLPGPAEGVDAVYGTWMGDHLHARVCYHMVCDGTGSGQRMGDWHGLALDANGDLWHAGKWTAGLIAWDSSPHDWFARNGAAFKHAFGDPYAGPGSGNEPVFQVPQEGDPVYLTAVAVCPNGKVWFSSSGPTSVSDTVAVFGPGFTTYAAQDLGLGESSVADMVCLPDGRLVLAGFSTGLAIYDPATGTKKTIRAGQGIPDDHVQALELDRMPSPPALHVATDSGATVLRVLP